MVVRARVGGGIAILVCLLFVRNGIFVQFLQWKLHHQRSYLPYYAQIIAPNRNKLRWSQTFHDVAICRVVHEVCKVMPWIGQKLFHIVSAHWVQLGEGGVR